VLTRNRPSLAAESAVAPDAESVRFAVEPSCLIATLGGLPSPVWMMIEPLLPVTHAFGAIV
jgi:hypothetical protein